MKKRNLLIILIIVVVLGISLGFGFYYLNSKNTKNDLDDTPDINKENDEILNFLTIEEALEILKEKYKDDTYLISYNFGENDFYFFDVINKRDNLIEMIVSINKYTKEVKENKIIVVGDDIYQGIFGGKINKN